MRTVFQVTRLPSGNVRVDAAFGSIEIFRTFRTLRRAQQWIAAARKRGDQTVYIEPA